MTLALSQCPGIDPVKDSSAALQAALNLKQPLMWDCRVAHVAGSDPTKSIFVPDGSDVTFTPAGQLLTDAVGFPVLAFMHASGIWRGLNIRYIGTFGVAMPPSGGAWTDGPAKTYLVRNNINTVFSGVGGTFWSGPSNASALVSIRGSSNVTLQGGSITAAPDAPASQFAFAGVGLDAAYVPGIICAPGAALCVPNVSVSDFFMDGVCMGFVGGGGKVSFTRMTRKRYADMEDGITPANIGGIGQWSSPPHWFYLQGSLANPMTATLTDCVDLGEFTGSGRRSVTSGFINSAKIELANGSSINGYYSRCLDGGLAVLSNNPAAGGTVRNAYYHVDTSIVDVNGKPAGTPGLFFPSNHPYPPSDIEMAIDNRAAAWPVSSVPAGVTTRLTVRCNV